MPKADAASFCFWLPVMSDLLPEVGGQLYNKKIQMHGLVIASSTNKISKP
jgi:hypothetical protein